MGQSQKSQGSGLGRSIWGGLGEEVSLKPVPGWAVCAQGSECWIWPQGEQCLELGNISSVGLAWISHEGPGSGWGWAGFRGGGTWPSHVRRLAWRASQPEAHRACPFHRLVAGLNDSPIGKTPGLWRTKYVDLTFHGAKMLFSAGHPCVDTDRGPGSS